MSELGQNKKEDWREKALCRDGDPELFFPASDESKAGRLQIQEAKYICGRCAVRETCLIWALDHDEEYGVWGGLSEDERRALKGRRVRRPYNNTRRNRTSA